MFNLDGPPSESHAMTRFYAYFNGKYLMGSKSMFSGTLVTLIHIQAIQVTAIPPPKCLLKPSTCLIFITTTLG